MTTFRIHPAIGIARVGNSESYYLGPETRAGVPDADGLVGGLPINKDTRRTITSSELRDEHGALKRQAARFRIFQYPDGAEQYPRGGGEEVTIGTRLDSVWSVLDILWTVHLANKKANAYRLDENRGLDAYDDGKTPGLRNPDDPRPGPEGPDDPRRIAALVIDPGPRTIHHRGAGPVRFDASTPASHVKQGDREPSRLPRYPVNFPARTVKLGEPITSLGELYTDEDGRLHVVAASGRAAGWAPLSHDVNNDGWFDDIADGPVSAVLVVVSALTAHVKMIPVEGSAWVITTDPAFAPQIPNTVTLWDDIYDTWLRLGKLRPEVFDGENFSPEYKPSFEDEVRPLFLGVGLLRWVANLNKEGIAGHASVAAIAGKDPASGTLLKSLGQIRDPNRPDAPVQRRQMPMSLGDAGKSMLSLTRTQYFFLQQWNAGAIDHEGRPGLGPAEQLDRAVLVNCLGGRFSPGIEMTFVCRDMHMWQDPKIAGPFRALARPLKYTTARKDAPFLTGGYVPRRPGGLEPGDLTKFMAIPWHTDYNSCAAHPPTPGIYQDNRVYWSWPAQRPVAVYPASQVAADGRLPDKPWYSVRDPRDPHLDPRTSGRFQRREDFLERWSDVGTVMQALAIDEPGGLPASYFLEVKGKLAVTDADRVDAFPNEFKPGSDPPASRK